MWSASQIKAVRETYSGAGVVRLACPDALPQDLTPRSLQDLTPRSLAQELPPLRVATMASHVTSPSRNSLYKLAMRRTRNKKSNAKD